jgi:hypothetical protein
MEPLFLLPQRSRLKGLGESLKVLCKRTKFPMGLCPNYPFRSLTTAPSKLNGESLGVSLLVHCSAVLIMLHLPAIRPQAREMRSSLSQETIYYLPPSTSVNLLPRIVSRGPGAHAGAGSQSDSLPVLGATASNTALTIVSRPLHPDNARQTIYQPSTAPDLHIDAELKLPNIAEAELPEPQKPVAELLKELKPLAPSPRTDTAMSFPAPTITEKSSAIPQFSTAQPRLPITGLSVPRSHAAFPTSAPAPAITSNAPTSVPELSTTQPRLPITALSVPRNHTELPSLALAPEIAANASSAVPELSTDQPRLPITGLPAPRPSPARAAASAAPVIASNGSFVVPETPNIQPRLPITSLSPPRKPASSRTDDLSGDGTSPNGLLIIGVDPSEEMSRISLPAGNRWGEFSVSVMGEQPGSPGGSLTGIANSGSGAKGPGGDKSTAVGPGDEGGGGGNLAADGRVSVAPSAPIGKSSADPNGLVGSAKMVNSVRSRVAPRTQALVISAGPRGGGGLQVYGALPCGKIYTIFLPMPGGAWTLQFCRAGESTASDTRSATIRLEPTIVPPDPEVKFDFQRLPLPADKAHKMIVLKGSMKADGTVDDLQIYQGVLPQMDEAARLAFSHWTFKPAMSGGNPLRIEILLGIPVGSSDAH